MKKPTFKIQQRLIEELFSSDDIKDGLTAIINVRLHDPQFERQTKGRLGNNFVRKNRRRIRLQ